MKLTTKLIAGLLATTSLIAGSPAFAQDDVVDLGDGLFGNSFTSGWNGEASLAGSKTTGNTDTTDIGVAIKLQKETNQWRHNLYGSADFGENDDVTNKQRFTAGYKLDRNLTERLYTWGNIDYFNDDFGAFENGVFLGTGLGYKAILPAPAKWDLEVGLGYRSQSPQRPDVPGDVTQAEFDLLDAEGDFDRTNELALRGASFFDYDFNDNVSLFNNSEIIYSSSDTYVWNDIGVTAQLFGNLAARASFRVDYHSDPLPGVESTDTITRVGVVYAIK